MRSCSSGRWSEEREKIIIFCPDLYVCVSSLLKVRCCMCTYLPPPFYILSCTSINCQNLNDLHTKCIFLVIGFLPLFNQIGRLAFFGRKIRKPDFSTERKMTFKRYRVTDGPRYLGWFEETLYSLFSLSDLCSCHCR